MLCSSHVAEHFLQETGPAVRDILAHLCKCFVAVQARQSPLARLVETHDVAAADYKETIGFIASFYDPENHISVVENDQASLAQARKFYFSVGLLVCYQECIHELNIAKSVLSAKSRIWTGSHLADFLNTSNQLIHGRQGSRTGIKSAMAPILDFIKHAAVSDDMLLRMEALSLAPALSTCFDKKVDRDRQNASWAFAEGPCLFQSHSYLLFQSLFLHAYLAHDGQTSLPYQPRTISRILSFSGGSMN